MSDSGSEDSQGFKKAKNAYDYQRKNLEKLMKNPEREVEIPDLKDDKKLPRAFFPHEYVRNVMGASAGAGSGEFDIYRGCRRRENIRQEFLQAQADKQNSIKEFEEKRLANLAKAEEKTAKKRAKRLKQKLKAKKKDKSKTDDDAKSDSEPGENSSQEEIEIDLNEKLHDKPTESENTSDK